MSVGRFLGFKAMLPYIAQSFYMNRIHYSLANSTKIEKHLIDFIDQCKLLLFDRLFT